MAEPKIRPAMIEDAERLAIDLRPADRAEIIAASGPDTLATIRQAIRVSTHCWAAEDGDGGLVALFGFAPVSLLAGIGSPWLLATPRLERIPGALTRLARRYLADIATTYPVLGNPGDARNTASIRWLQRLGFQIGPPKPYGAAGLPFHRFEMRS